MRFSSFLTSISYRLKRMVAECYIDECVLKIGNSSNSHKMVDLLGKPMIFCLFPVHFGDKHLLPHIPVRLDSMHLVDS